MLDLFRMELESQTPVLTGGLLQLEWEPTAADQLEACMRAAHSLKGAARIIGLDIAVNVAHAMEDCFVNAQKGHITLRKAHVDTLLRGVDFLSEISKKTEVQLADWTERIPPEAELFLASLAAVLEGKEDLQPSPTPAIETQVVTPAGSHQIQDRVLRVTAQNLNRLLGLAGESLVESRWLRPFTEALQRLKRLHSDTAKKLETLQAHCQETDLRTALSEVRHHILECQQTLSQRLMELDLFDRRSSGIAQRLYDEALACRMRPFADGIQIFPRMVRDLAHTLGKEVKLEIVGESTQVDPDVLEKLEAPLNHLLRNAIDHGVGSPEQRIAAGKKAEGTI